MKNRHWPAALASFLIVGLGQIIKGEGDKGLKLMLTFYFALPAVVYIALLLNGFFFLIVLGLLMIAGIVLWGYNIWDALNHEP
ncbi:hypothetical protein A2625_05645 [candidate division WOR-1 bacterium RIFCSPHIGHO2_01_FULL_53_15]|uniref:DUF5683 domain-containing protein n=1 Tax=candidate division WOR-1 bacterium RIFCSPHIGHO2_01_FULL_53_15 TaxID=1802564 RepID=A0A1F4Q325_UNCSA|nr:MAG: hypothetical protein A2625_05645 [candidate division WOR-1 bacterium RIFCSPHIGHO2_01_FULL_53_15]OGC10515.1 MAG: hypothetical protein A3D23_04180 [candidate division WOR-1 bacterium RIFCSPHIGHO2_02_FULL_53_26]